MKLIIILLLLTITSTRARHYLKCGPVDAKCLPANNDLTCPQIPFCPTGLKRKLTSKGCCCVLRDSFRGKTVVPEIISTEKSKISSKTLKNLQNFYNEITDLMDVESQDMEVEQKQLLIKKLSKNMSDTMKSAIKELATLVDVDSEIIFKCIFDDVKIFENKKINLIIDAANEIYEKGNELMERISMVMERMEYY
ncbi:unnamed protein product [Chironomus riparius]|uniref:Uncharacterized protein n=1 Tax=Chironomus riparius TaxID=315576 RepID=A0A9N9WYB9_9DIPT|nr:unnamed protein product [Chironomus riparius]